MATSPLPLSFPSRADYLARVRREALFILRAYPSPAEGRADRHEHYRDDDTARRLNGMHFSEATARAVLGFSDHPLAAENMLGVEGASACPIDHRARLAMLADIREMVLAFRDIPDVLASVLRITKEAHS